MVIRRNAIIFASMGGLAFILLGVMLVVGKLLGFPDEVILILATGMIASGPATLFALASQVMTPDPPNPHQAYLDHKYRMAGQKAKDQSMVAQSVDG